MSSLLCSTHTVLNVEVLISVRTLLIHISEFIFGIPLVDKVEAFLVVYKWTAMADETDTYSAERGHF